MGDDRGESMAIYIFGGTKGGTGKSTLSVNFAVSLARMGRKVLLVDTDQQGSASVWCHLRAEAGILPAIPLAILDGRNVGNQIRDLSVDYKDVVIDVAGYNSVELHSALDVSDVLVTPARSGYFDFHALSMLNPLLGEIRRTSNPQLRSLLLLNGMSTHSRARDATTMRNSVAPFKEFKVLSSMAHQRGAFSDAIPHGKAVMEHKPVNKKAIAELHSITREVIKHGR